MSQISQFFTPEAFVQSLTGDAGPVVFGDAGGNIDLLGGTNINTIGAVATMTINLDDAITLTTVNATTFDTDVLAAAVTLSGTTLSADGTDVDISINITSKGAGTVIIDELTLTTPLAVPQGGTGVVTNTANGLLLGNGAADITATAELSDGQLPIGSTGNPPVPATLTAGINIIITNAPGSITIDATGNWIEVVGVTQAMAIYENYIANNAALVTLTLPAVTALGDVIEVVGKGAGGWKIAQNAGQIIHFIGSDTTAGVGGSIASTNRYDAVYLLCITANTDFLVKSSVGNLTIV